MQILEQYLSCFFFVSFPLESSWNGMQSMHLVHFLKLLRTNLSEENIPDHQFHCYEIKQPVGVCFHVLV